jgi:5-amino-6-(5-phosphoribosylamino)uracil reductase
VARPRVVLSVAASVDGYIDDASADRLILSGDADLDRVDGERAAADAILVGAGTIRRDDPRLLVRDPARVAARVAAGRSPQPLKATVSGRGDLDPAARFFTTGDQPKLV